MCKGTFNAKQTTLEITKVCHQDHPALEEKLGYPCTAFEQKSLKQQYTYKAFIP